MPISTLLFDGDKLSRAVLGPKAIELVIEALNDGVEWIDHKLEVNDDYTEDDVRRIEGRRAAYVAFSAELTSAPLI
jgi:hypothetical protein